MSPSVEKWMNKFGTKLKYLPVKKDEVFVGINLKGYKILSRIGLVLCNFDASCLLSMGKL